MAGFSTTEFRGMAGQPSGGGGLAVQQPTAVPVYMQNIDGAGQQGQANPAFFQNLMNMLGGINIPAGAANIASKAARYGPGAAAAVQQFGAGQPIAAGATLGLTALAGKGLQAATAAIPNPLVRGAVQLAGGVLAAPIASQLGQGVASVGNQLIGGAQAATRDVTGAIAGAQREAGQSAFTGREVGLGGASQTELDRQIALLRQLGVNNPTEALQSQYQITQKYKDADMGRQMQLNQQLGQLTGALNRQMATYQIGSQALGEASATTRQILASNPYANSVLNTGAVRGI